MLIKQKIRDFIAFILSRILKRFAFDPKYFNLWQSNGYHVKPISFYSPLPNTEELPEGIWDNYFNIRSFDWNTDEQLDLLRDFKAKYSSEYNKFPRSKTQNDSKFHFGNISFESVDAEILYCMIRHFRPSNIIEIGSGYSSLLALEAIELNKQDNYPCNFTAIEPYPPQFLKTNLSDSFELVEEPLQKIPLEFFEKLKSGDILFIDSSHVCKIGSDVQYEFLSILPCLAEGVIVHIHDIFLPNEYPKQWVKDWHRFWNEQYILQAFLSFNSDFKILWAGSYMHLQHSKELSDSFDSYDSSKNWPASFWIKRVAS